MTTQQAKSILILRRSDNGDEQNYGHQPAKVQRLASSDGSPDEPMPTIPTTKIVHLTEGCLVNIFECLDLASLLSVAAASKWLRPAAAEVYDRKFGAMLVKMFECSDEIDACLYERYESIEVYGLKTCLHFLRCFGSTIRDLLITYTRSNTKQYQYVFEQVADFCTKGLNRIRFWSMPNIGIVQQRQMAFGNVKTVEFCFSDLGQHWPTIVECFPNIQNLILMHNDHGKGDSMIRAPLNSLKGICIVASSLIRSQKTVKNLLHMASQLKRLKITTTDNLKIPMNTLLDWIKFDQGISKLIVKHPELIETIGVSAEDVQQLIDNNPALVVLDLYNYQFAPDDAIKVVRELGSLKQFRLLMDRSDYTYLVNQLGLVWEVNYVSVGDVSDDSNNCSDSGDDIILVELKRE